MSDIYKNNDGVIQINRRSSAGNKAGYLENAGNKTVLVVREVTATSPNVDIDTTGNGTKDSFSELSAAVPAYSAITNAYLTVTEAFVTADAAVLNIGLLEKDGTAIDADGVFSAIAAASLTKGAVVPMDGALQNVSIGDADGYLAASQATGTFSAGKAVLTLEFVDASASGLVG